MEHDVLITPFFPSDILLNETTSKGNTVCAILKNFLPVSGWQAELSRVSQE
eukprot:m.4874 g.4874  ORF g.4874 m.4874 type:complete len:51 (+) comp3774_c0_seq1:67-219(+)